MRFTRVAALFPFFLGWLASTPLADGDFYLKEGDRVVFYSRC